MLFASSFRSQDIYIFLLIFAQVEKRLNWKIKLFLKSYDVANRLTNNYDTHIVQYLTK